MKLRQELLSSFTLAPATLNVRTKPGAIGLGPIGVGMSKAKLPARLRDTFNGKPCCGGRDQIDPTLNEVSIAYLNQNLPPEILSLSVSNATERTNAANPSADSAMPNLGIKVAVAANSGYPLATKTGQTAGKKPPVTISWQAKDPNGDSLEYSIYLKSTDEKGLALAQG